MVMATSLVKDLCLVTSSMNMTKFVIILSVFVFKEYFKNLRIYTEKIVNMLFFEDIIVHNNIISAELVYVLLFKKSS